MPSDDVSAMRKALVAIETLQAKLKAAESGGSEPIAVVGMACRFPAGVGAAAGTSLNSGIADFWKMLCDGRDAVREVPAERWSADGFYDRNPDAPGKMVTRWGGFLDKLDTFDADFFEISGREAALLDPQGRLLLECAWEALEDAGLPPEGLSGSATGVFVGACTSDYSQMQFAELNTVDAYSTLGTSPAILANRLSYLFDLRGPSVSSDTACSSSLVALHQAVRSLRSKETNMALVGGVNALLYPGYSVSFSKFGMMSPDGRCKTFDAMANGYVRGEGCGVVVLKRLSDALAAGDPIWALVKGTAINQDGRTNGLTAPSGPAQVEVIKRALTDGQVDAASVGLIECHGTGTPLGDPVEVNAIKEVYGRTGSGEAQPCYLGAAKTSIGHLEGAAGIAGLIKGILSLHHRAIPKVLHFKTLNPNIALGGSRFEIATEHKAWSSRTPRRAAVSSFGFGGTNAHVVLEEAPAAAVNVTPRPPQAELAQLLVVSAKTPTALRELAQRYQALLADPQQNFYDVAASAATRRSHHAHRVAVVAKSREQAAERLDSYLKNQPTQGVHSGVATPGNPTKLAFVFSGQGTQWWAMGREMLAQDAVFRNTLERVDGLLKKHVSWSLLQELQRSEADSKLGATEYAQPALFAVQTALVAVLQGWGIVPSAVVGHSIGEVAAAHAAGVLSLEDAVMLAALRGKLMQEATGKGKMLSAELSTQQANTLLMEHEGTVALAVINGPKSVVFAGDAAAMDSFAALLADKKVETRWLPVNYAFHSPHMESIAPRLAQALSGLKPSPPKLSIVSSLTGRTAESSAFDAAYWQRQMREAVRFSGAMETLIGDGFTTFLEVGPHPALGHNIHEILSARSVEGSVAFTLRRSLPERDTLLNAAATLHSQGVSVAWQGMFQSATYVRLPHYTWQRKRHWIAQGAPRAPTELAAAAPQSAPVRGDASTPLRSHPLLQGERALSLEHGGMVWDLALGDSMGFWQEHQIRGEIVVPGAAYIELALAAGAALFGAQPCLLEEVIFARVCTLPEVGSRAVQLALTRVSNQSAKFIIASPPNLPGDPWTVHASGILRATAQLDLQARLPRRDVATLVRGDSPAVIENDVIEHDVKEHYEALAARGVALGKSFQSIRTLRRAGATALAALDPAGIEPAGFALHPALLDAGLQTLGTACGLSKISAEPETFLPMSVGRARQFDVEGPVAWAHAVLHPTPLSPDSFTGDVEFLNADGHCMVQLQNVTLRRVEKRQQAGGVDGWLQQMQWEEQPVGEGTAQPEGRWGIFADRGGVGQKLAQALREAGGQAVIINAGNAGSNGHVAKERMLHEVDPSSPDAMRALIAALGSDGSPLRAVIYLWGLDVKAPDSVGVDDLLARTAVDGALHLAQALSMMPVPVWLATCGAQGPNGSVTAHTAWQTPLLGLGRTLALESAALACTLVDLDPQTSDVAGLVRELITTDPRRAGGRDTQIVYRGARRLVPRIDHITTHVALPEAASAHSGPRPFRMELRGVGSLECLKTVAFTPEPPGPGQVQVRIQAAGVNFRDTMKTMGIYPGAPPGRLTIGDEAAGEVVAVGEGVTHLQVGQSVVAVGRDCFGSHMTTDARLCWPLPSKLSPEEGVTVPVAFGTAYYALRTLARLRKGERVLIHSASGGVGLAAVQIAQWVGAEIYATAGNDEKREFLRYMGVKNVLNSRTLAFADDVMRMTQGQGVDVVLNALSGDAIAKSLQCLRANGRFVEIGKTDIYADMALHLNPFRRRLSYFAVDFDPMLFEQTDLVSAMIRSVFKRIDRGEFQPLSMRTYPLSEITNAFAAMAKAQHIGKLVLTVDTEDPNVVVQSAPQRVPIVKDATYLVTGGLGALGMSVAQWLVDQGARNLVLTARRPANPAAESQLATLRRGGAKVKVAAVDVASLPAMEALLADLTPPLRGIFHVAGILEDGILPLQDKESFSKVMAPKVLGSWNLHTLTANMQLDCFVMFSSMSALLGPPGQSNYAAANMFMEGLAHLRRARGLAALTLHWGPFSEIGMAADPDLNMRLRKKGLHSLTPAQGMLALETLMASPLGALGVMPFEADKWAEDYLVAGALLQRVAKGKRTKTHEDMKQVLAGTPIGQRRDKLEEHMRELIAQVMKVELERVQASTQLRQLGMDSLLALDLRNRVEMSLGATFSMANLNGNPSVAALAAEVGKKMGLALDHDGSAPVAAAPADSNLQSAIDALSEAELDALLAAQGQGGT